MSIDLHAWLARASVALRALADRPWTLFAVLLLLNSLARPYAGFCQDARLYSGQVLNQVEHGAFAEDLFFRYGSQDQLSIFSRLAAPVASLVGLEAGFFLLYVACNTLFLLALYRLVRALVEDKAAATLALVYLVVTPLPFGGLHTFYVHEAFLTPRLAANALVLFALERVFRRRYLPALALLGGAALMHPLMALGGLLVWGGSATLAYLRPRTVVILLALATAAGLVIVAHEPFGVAVFGRLDPQWYDILRGTSVYAFAPDWEVVDWVDPLVSIALLLASAVWLYHADPARRHFALVLAVTGAVGLVGTVLAAVLPYALLLQGQPYRVLWLVKAVQAPLGFALIARLSRLPGPLPQALALLLIGYFSITTFLAAEIILPLVLMVFLVLCYRGLDKAPRYADWLWRSGVLAIAVSSVCWTVFKWLVLIAYLPVLTEHLDVLDYVQRAVIQFGPLWWLLLLCLIALHLGRRDRRTRWACLGLAAAYQLTWFAVPSLDLLRVRGTQEGQDVLFVRDFLSRRHADHGPRPTLYSSLGRIDYLWVDLRCKSFYDGGQISGVLFNRRTAVEAQRRALLVRRFEIDRYRRMEAMVQPVYQRSMRRLYLGDFDCPEPTIEDLGRLCQEPGLDYVIAKHEIPGLAAADNGRIYIYDCRQVRAALQLPEPTPASAVAALPDRLPR